MFIIIFREREREREREEFDETRGERNFKKKNDIQSYNNRVKYIVSVVTLQIYIYLA